MDYYGSLSLEAGGSGSGGGGSVEVPIKAIKVNGVAQVPVSNTVDITVPEKTSDLEDDTHKEILKVDYEALTDDEKANGTLYFCTDTGEIYRNGILYGVSPSEDVFEHFVKVKGTIGTSATATITATSIEEAFLRGTADLGDGWTITFVESCDCPIASALDLFNFATEKALEVSPSGLTLEGVILTNNSGVSSGEFEIVYEWNTYRPKATVTYTSLEELNGAKGTSIELVNGQDACEDILNALESGEELVLFNTDLKYFGITQTNYVGGRTINRITFYRNDTTGGAIAFLRGTNEFKFIIGHRYSKSIGSILPWVFSNGDMVNYTTYYGHGTLNSVRGTSISLNTTDYFAQIYEALLNNEKFVFVQYKHYSIAALGIPVDTSINVVYGEVTKSTYGKAWFLGDKGELIVGYATNTDIWTWTVNQPSGGGSTPTFDERGIIRTYRSLEELSDVRGERIDLADYGYNIIELCGECLEEGEVLDLIFDVDTDTTWADPDNCGIGRDCPKAKDLRRLQVIKAGVEFTTYSALAFDYTGAIYTYLDSDGKWINILEANTVTCEVDDIDVEGGYVMGFQETFDSVKDYIEYLGKNVVLKVLDGDYEGVALPVTQVTLDKIVFSGVLNSSILTLVLDENDEFTVTLTEFGGLDTYTCNCSVTLDNTSGNHTISGYDGDFTEMKRVLASGGKVQMLAKINNTSGYVLDVSYETSNSLAFTITTTVFILTISIVEGSEPTIRYTNLNAISTEIEALKKSVSDGKTEVADAITANGVETATDAEFAVMAENVNVLANKLKVPCGTDWVLVGEVTGSPSIYYKDMWFIKTSDKLYYSKDGMSFEPCVTETGEEFNPGGAFRLEYLSETGVWFCSRNNTTAGLPIYYSEDGIVWKPSNLVNTEIRSVYYGNGVAIGFNQGLYPNVTYYTEDGKTWLESDLTIKVSTTFFLNGKFFASPTTSSNTEKTHYSYNGKEWFALDTIYTSIIYAVDRYFAVTKASDVVYSYDGVTWSSCRCSDIIGHSMYGRGFQHVAYNNGVWVGVTFGGAYFSLNGIDWTKISIVPSSSYSVYYNKGVWLCVGVSGPSNGKGIYYSHDGINWVASNFNYYMSSPYTVNGKFLFIRPLSTSYSNPVQIYGTSDNESWDLLSDNVYFELGNSNMLINSKLEYSFDGVTWHKSNLTDKIVAESISDSSISVYRGGNVYLAYVDSKLYVSREVPWIETP